MEEWAIVLHDRPVRKFTISEGKKITIGRGAEANVVIDNTAISRVHAALELRDGVYYIHDLKSTNGTTVNGERVTDMLPIAKDDLVELGKFRLLPAAALTGAAVSSSFAADMGGADETMFMSSKNVKPEQRSRVGGAVERPRLVVISGDATPPELGLKGKSSVKIGSGPGCDLRVKGWLVAAAQCYLIKRDERYLLVPQSSWAATRVNGLKIKEEKELLAGDVIAIRKTQIRFD